MSGDVSPTTGLIVNVSDIDNRVREYIVPVFAEKIRAAYSTASHIGHLKLTELLKLAWAGLADKFGPAHLSKLSLKLNPFRTLAIDKADCRMVYFSEKFEFAAAHKLWNEQFSEQQNIKAFGRCANPTGHGHNYLVEVTVKWPVAEALRTSDFERIVNQGLIKAIDHKNLNEDLPEFRQTNPTVENIAVFAWNKLVGRFGKAALHCVTIWETDKTYSSYYG